MREGDKEIDRWREREGGREIEKRETERGEKGGGGGVRMRGLHY